ncbi:hypothetical protein N7495_009186 [Penicillium taxi]|uniref:uncharacterized protein n=1 Tax=Penicillium taxi TaxID=168475 RepID=UPI0025452770|nr:uncharacterized protein N7495_009186 [Penicillium taxi]KAJ5884676.1 hypothetical protein N7495_009186 [Penicillium taxi]
MNFREKVRRVFHRSSNSTSSINGRPQVEYYKKKEIPPSKFKGPFDKAHQKSLASWTFEGAMVERTRSLEQLSLSPLSPCATLGAPCVSDSDSEISPDDVPSVPGMIQYYADLSFRNLWSDSNLVGIVIPVENPLELELDPLSAAPRANSSGSQSSTIVDSESYSASLMTLLPENSLIEATEDHIAQIKESMKYCSPIVRTITPVTMSPRGKCLPFSPEDLTRALAAVQVCA